ncbi:hypothetical protein VFC2021_10100 [Listeria innocua]
MALFYFLMYKIMYIDTICVIWSRNLSKSILNVLISPKMVVHDKNRTFHYIFGYTFIFYAMVLVGTTI